MKLLTCLLILFSLTFNSVNAAVYTPSSNWYTAGANFQRTSWVSNEAVGTVKPLWYKVVEPYIQQRSQILAVDDVLYFTHANGMAALNANNGNTIWRYDTQLPLGHTPTYYKGRIYVGGYDNKLHILNATNGQVIFTFGQNIKGGIDNAPAVLEFDGKKVIYFGSRDGSLYAMQDNGNSGSLLWSFKTQGPVNFSPAILGNNIYIASNDSFAYSINAKTGIVNWKSSQLPGAGFHSWWPVAFKDTNGVEYVLFTGSNNYSTANEAHWGAYFQNKIEKEEIWPGIEKEATFNDFDTAGPEVTGGNYPSWANGKTVLDLSKSFRSSTGNNTTPVSEYYEQKNWRRTMFVFNAQTGKEVTSDFDNDGRPEYAPFLWFGTHSGNKYPPIVNPQNGKVYISATYLAIKWIPRGGLVGWKIGSPYVELTEGGNASAADEPRAYSGAGDYIYRNLCCDRNAGYFSATTTGSSKTFYSYHNPSPTQFFPDYRQNYVNYMLERNLWSPNEVEPYTKPGQSYKGKSQYTANAIYGAHGDNPAMTIHNNKIITHRSNSIIVFTTSGGSDVGIKAPDLNKQTPQNTSDQISATEVKAKLYNEIDKVLQNGTNAFLKPGYTKHSIWDTRREYPDTWYNHIYYKNPADTIVVLTRALKHIDDNTKKQNLKTYIQNYYNKFLPYQYKSTGWKETLVQRDLLQTPPEVEDSLNAKGKEAISTNDKLAHNYYALYLYAKEFGNAKQIFDNAKQSSLYQILNNLNVSGSTSEFVEFPQYLNSYITGAYYYLELQKLAGYSEDTAIKNKLTQLINYKTNNFNISYNFNYTTIKEKYRTTSANYSPFLHMSDLYYEYLRNNMANQINNQINAYTYLTPFWFVTKTEQTYAEAVIHPLYDRYAIFQAKAYVQGEDFEELVKYIDVPAFQIGDLYYIDNLVATLDSYNGTIPEPSIDPTPTNNPNPTTSPTPNYDIKFDINKDGFVNITDAIDIIKYMFGVN